MEYSNLSKEELILLLSASELELKNCKEKNNKCFEIMSNIHHDNIELNEQMKLGEELLSHFETFKKDSLNELFYKAMDKGSFTEIIEKVMPSILIFTGNFKRYYNENASTPLEKDVYEKYLQSLSNSLNEEETQFQFSRWVKFQNSTSPLNWIKGEDKLLEFFKSVNNVFFNEMPFDFFQWHFHGYYNTLPLSLKSNYTYSDMVYLFQSLENNDFIENGFHKTYAVNLEKHTKIKAKAFNDACANYGKKGMGKTKEIESSTNSTFIDELIKSLL